MFTHVVCPQTVRLAGAGLTGVSCVAENDASQAQVQLVRSSGRMSNVTVLFLTMPSLPAGAYPLPRPPPFGHLPTTDGCMDGLVG